MTLKSLLYNSINGKVTVLLSNRTNSTWVLLIHPCSLNNFGYLFSPNLFHHSSHVSSVRPLPLHRAKKFGALLVCLRKSFSFSTPARGRTRTTTQTKSICPFCSCCLRTSALICMSQIRKGILLLFLISSHWEKYFYLYGVSLFTETYMYLWEFAPNFSSISWRDPWHVTHAYMSLGSNHAFLLEGGRTGEEEEYVMWRQIERDMKSRHRQIRAIWSILHLVNNIFRGQLGSETSQKELSLPFIAFSDRPLEEFTLWAVTVTLLYNR